MRVWEAGCEANQMADSVDVDDFTGRLLRACFIRIDKSLQNNCLIAHPSDGDFQITGTEVKKFGLS
jgi:hypothetical protein